MIPSAGDARPFWKLADFQNAVNQAHPGRIAVLQFHGVPDLVHPWVNTPQEQFERFMKYLHDENYVVIAMRDLAKYVDPAVEPKNHMEIIEDRQRMLAAGKSRGNYRTPENEDDLRYWLENMVVHHAFSVPEIGAATGLSSDDIAAALKKFKLARPEEVAFTNQGRIKVLPYPGGRHPRISFLDGAMRPQRETKVSIFAPWPDSGYAVYDLPEAIWVNADPGRELLYLAHTHVPTRWSRQNVDLEALEWSRQSDGSLTMERTLPNQVKFGTTVVPEINQVAMEMWLTNGSRPDAVRFANPELRDAQGGEGL